MIGRERRGGAHIRPGVLPLPPRPCNLYKYTTPSVKGNEYWYLWSDNLAKKDSFVTVTVK